MDFYSNFHHTLYFLEDYRLRSLFFGVADFWLLSILAILDEVLHELALASRCSCWCLTWVWNLIFRRPEIRKLLLVEFGCLFEVIQHAVDLLPLLNFMLLDASCWVSNLSCHCVWALILLVLLPLQWLIVIVQKRRMRLVRPGSLLVWNLVVLLGLREACILVIVHNFDYLLARSHLLVRWIHVIGVGCLIDLVLVELLDLLVGGSTHWAVSYESKLSSLTSDTLCIRPSVDILAVDALRVVLRRLRPSSCCDYRFDQIGVSSHVFVRWCWLLVLEC